MWIKESFSSLSRKLFLSPKVIENSNANFYIQTIIKNRRLISHHMWSTVSWCWWIQVFKPVATHMHTWRKSTLLLVWLLTGGRISLDLRKTTTCEYRYIALEFKSITCGSKSAPLALSQWRRPLTIRHHSEFLFLYERPRRSHRRRQLLMQFLFGDVASSEMSFRSCLSLQNKKDPLGVGRRSLLRRSSQSNV